MHIHSNHRGHSKNPRPTENEASSKIAVNYITAISGEDYRRYGEIVKRSHTYYHETEEERETV